MKSSLKKSAFILAACFVVLLSTCKKDDKETPLKRAVGLYFTFYGGNTVNKIDIINTPNSVTGLFNAGDGIAGPAGIALTDDGYLLVCNITSNSILKMHKSGTGPVDLVYDNTDGVNRPTAVAVNNSSGVIYWCNSGTDQIMKGRDDGSVAPVTMFGGAAVIDDAFGIAIDPARGKIYTGDFNQGIKAGNLDGSGTPVVLYNTTNVPGMGSPSNIFVSSERNRIYWADESSNEILVAGIDGTSTPQVLFDFGDGVNRPDGISVDYQAGKIYWSETSNDVIARGNLDGSGAREVMVDNVRSYGLVLEFE